MDMYELQVMEEPETRGVDGGKAAIIDLIGGTAGNYYFYFNISEFIRISVFYLRWNCVRICWSTA